MLKLTPGHRSTGIISYSAVKHPQFFIDFKKTGASSLLLEHSSLLQYCELSGVAIAGMELDNGQVLCVFS
jgi:hypothetical protein